MTARRGASQQRMQELLALLVHDVGKYLARTARNLPAGEPVDAELVVMLCRDLYGDAVGTRPAIRFSTLAAALQPLFPEAPLAPIASHFATLDDLEAAVRAGKPAAVARAAALALQIEAQLRALAAPRPRASTPRGR
jgi:hypothetical protein